MKHDRPPDESYYERERVSLFSQGDVFRDVPLGYPTVLEIEERADAEHPEDWLSAGTRRFLSGPLDFGRAMLITPTCSMGAQGGAAGYAHPVRTLVVVRSIEDLLREEILVSAQVDTMRLRDSLVNYMYLPQLGDELPESAALLYYPVTLHHDFLEGQRVTQLAYEGAQQLQRKLGAFFGGYFVERSELDPPMD